MSCDRSSSASARLPARASLFRSSSRASSRSSSGRRRSTYWGFGRRKMPSTSEAIAVDSAFHEAGLNYGSADETVGRVLKKMIRAAVAIEGYLEVGEATIIFAAPKVAEPILEPIERHLASLRNRVCRGRLGGTKPALSADRQPRFLRCDSSAGAGSSRYGGGHQRTLHAGPAADRALRKTHAAASAAHMNGATTDRGEGIGAHVRATMVKLATSGRLTPEIVASYPTPSTPSSASIWAIRSLSRSILQ